jgi:hypothetical protein
MLKVRIAVEVEVDARRTIGEVETVAVNVNEDGADIAGMSAIVAGVFINVNTLARAGGGIVFPTRRRT